MKEWGEVEIFDLVALPRDGFDACGVDLISVKKYPQRVADAAVVIGAGSGKKEIGERLVGNGKRFAEIITRKFLRKRSLNVLGAAARAELCRPCAP